MNIETNKIAGAVFASLLFVVGVNVIATSGKRSLEVMSPLPYVDRPGNLQPAAPE